MEKKTHFKLHKVKKHWVTIAVTGLTLIGLGATLPTLTVSADTANDTVTTTDGATATTETATTTDENTSQNTELKTEFSKQAVSEDSETKAALSLDNVKLIDGKYYYVNEDGSYKKNFAITVNGQLLYFDEETGALSSTSTYSFTEGLTNLTDNFTINNQVYDSTANSFEVVD
ncbi:KxYKxGKxW signal peptide [Streptococcus urinalis FB127-CNA-2]|uniref:KxYKxGKxW signal domain protein n=1 Tax=Streptococcus urinalis 2285-97 TaxID=764291 RepID=G5KCZ2_9STRE|nr:KxYKxGKxW signal domain protein [Streptococcus urinalis 2285-97]EKS17087.1 KxYKxGKxW signal peptide [Streptococcus urinalis FB127-CNA-2]VEF32663.1 dextransucrase [Streptococcus urinalis]